LVDEQDGESTHTAGSALPLLAGWIELWMLPVTMMARTLGFADNPLLRQEPEIDRDCEDAQLPVPNPHQNDMDSDLFA